MTVLNCKEAYFWKQRHKTIWLQRRWLFVQHSWIASTLRYFLYKLIGIKSYDQNKIKTVKTSAKVSNNNCIHKLQKLKGTKHSIFQNPDSNNCWTAEKKLEQQKKKCGFFLGFLFACLFLSFYREKNIPPQSTFWKSSHLRGTYSSEISEWSRILSFNLSPFPRVCISFLSQRKSLLI